MNKRKKIIKSKKATTNEHIMDFPKLESICGSSFCTFSVVENKLVTLYENQTKIYSVVCALLETISRIDNHDTAPKVYGKYILPIIEKMKQQKNEELDDETDEN